MSKFMTNIAKAIIRNDEMSNSVAIFALSETINSVPVAGYVIKVGPKSKALGYSEETGGKITSSTNSQTFKKAGSDNLLGAFAEALESLKWPSKVYIFTDNVDMYDTLTRLNSKEGERFRYVPDGSLISKDPSNPSRRMANMMRTHDVVVRMMTTHQNRWVSELKSQMEETATRHALEEYQRLKKKEEHKRLKKEEHKRLKRAEFEWKHRDDTDASKATGTNIQKEDDSKAINVCTSIKDEDDDQARYTGYPRKVRNITSLTLDEIATAGRSKLNED